MIILKDYQQRVLDALRFFFQQSVKLGNPAEAFQEVLLRNGRQVEPYIPVTAAGLTSGMPYICLRVPTGGGKTLLGCYAAGLAKTDFLQAERAVVLWLVPSTTILDQTADALRNPRHPYRRALDTACGSVHVVTINEALQISRAAVDGQTVVIVSTIQAFKAEDTTGRKVFDQNSTFAEHLQHIPSNRVADMLPGADGRPKPSLVNMLRLRRPIVIVDEAHNARTPLSFDMLGNVMPSCIIEFTATPARRGNPSNVLHHVSAAELKAADMIKLPLRVITRNLTQKDQLLAEALALRADLGKLAVAEGQKTGEYLRPILLIQAEKVDGCEPLRERLVNEFNIPKDQIKISVGSLDELKDIPDVASPNCPVTIILTVQKLREGWDCPFAYVLCSLKDTRSATAIEQIVGRILRLPNAKVKKHPDLNCAYAFSVSNSLYEVLNELREALESNGFTSAEAERIIVPVSQGTPSLGLWQKTVKFDLRTELDAPAAKAVEATLENKVAVDAVQGTILIRVPLEEKEIASIAKCLKTTEAQKRFQAEAETVRTAEMAFGGSGKPRLPYGYELERAFSVPRLSIREGTELIEFDDTHLVEHEWKLSTKDASLPASYNPNARAAGKAGILDAGHKGEVLSSELPAGAAAEFMSTLHQQVMALGGSADWTLEQLVGWLDGHIEHRDIPAGESAEFLRKVIRGVMAGKGLPDVSLLALDRFRLRGMIEDRIQEHRAAERNAAFQQYLLPGSGLLVDETNAIDFSKIVYEPSWKYEGGFEFKKHYFGAKPGELREGKQDGKLAEEFTCAQYIDAHEAVEYWIRNLARRTTSFRLQTSSDWAYPDFVCKLKDGRTLAVEYKGGYLYDSPDAVEKRLVGAVWAAQSGGRCLFVMPKADDFSAIDRTIQAR